MRAYQTAKRDANEREMVEAWRALGALWIPQPPGSGFDGVLITSAGAVYFVEVKDMRANHNKFYLTDDERKMRERIIEHGGRYEIVKNMAEALALVGAA